MLSVKTQPLKFLVGIVFLFLLSVMLVSAPSPDVCVNENGPYECRFNSEVGAEIGAGQLDFYEDVGDCTAGGGSVDACRESACQALCPTGDSYIEWVVGIPYCKCCEGAVSYTYRDGIGTDGDGHITFDWIPNDMRCDDMCPNSGSMDGACDNRAPGQFASQGDPSSGLCDAECKVSSACGGIRWSDPPWDDPPVLDEILPPSSLTGMTDTFFNLVFVRDPLQNANAYLEWGAGFASCQPSGARAPVPDLPVNESNPDFVFVSENEPAGDEWCSCFYDPKTCPWVKKTLTDLDPPFTYANPPWNTDSFATVDGAAQCAIYCPHGYKYVPGNGCVNLLGMNSCATTDFEWVDGFFPPVELNGTGDDGDDGDGGQCPSGCADCYEGDEPGECIDGADNDCDGNFDCADSSCAGSSDCSGSPSTLPSGFARCDTACGVPGAGVDVEYAAGNSWCNDYTLGLPEQLGVCCHSERNVSAGGSNLTNASSVCYEAVGILPELSEYALSNEELVAMCGYCANGHIDLCDRKVHHFGIDGTEAHTLSQEDKDATRDRIIAHIDDCIAGLPMGCGITNGTTHGGGSGGIGGGGPDVGECGTGSDGSGRGNDQGAPSTVNINDVVWLDTDVSGWPQTSTLSSVSISGTQIRLPHSKASSWPARTVDGTALAGNPWIFVWRNNKWYGGTWEWLRPGQTDKAHTSVAGDHIKRTPLTDFWPQEGETYGFMVSTLARFGERSIDERSNIVMFTWPNTGSSGSSDVDACSEDLECNPGDQCSGSGECECMQAVCAGGLGVPPGGRCAKFGGASGASDEYCDDDVDELRWSHGERLVTGGGTFQFFLNTNARGGKYFITPHNRMTGSPLRCQNHGPFGDSPPFAIEVLIDPSQDGQIINVPPSPSGIYTLGSYGDGGMSAWICDPASVGDYSMAPDCAQGEIDCEGSQCVCVDAECSGGLGTACSDGIDNDGDGLIDISDPGCLGLWDTSETDFATIRECNDGTDNDGDGLVDLSDPGCVDAFDDDETDPPTIPQCNDGVDNDGDGLIDFPADPGCLGTGDDDETDVPECMDTVDNDGDGLIDAQDPGCSDSLDNSELDDPECNDGIDNDGDGEIDFPADDGCFDTADNDETDPPPTCTDLDGDGFQGIINSTMTCDNDCDDSDATVYPGATELCRDSIDNNCDDLTDFEDTTACPLVETWDTRSSGVCQELGQCMVNPSGSTTTTNPDDYFSGVQPMCINDGAYIKDHLCEAGQWSSRTKQMVATMIEMASSSQKYNIFCSDYDSVLNYVDDDISGQLQSEYFEDNCQIGTSSLECTNTVCVVTTGSSSNPDTAVGATLNYNINQEQDYNILELFGEPITECQDVTSTANDYARCGSGQSSVWYNPYLWAVVNSPDMTVNRAATSSPLEELESILPESRDYTHVVAVKSGTRKIYGVIETYDNDAHLAIMYDNIDFDLCAVPGLENDCTEQGNKAWIIKEGSGSDLDEFKALLIDITQKVEI